MPKKKKGKPRRVAPDSLEGVACLLCDAVSRDPNTGKHSLYGVFDLMWAERFPLRYGVFTLYAQLKGKGKHRVSIHLVDPTGESKKLGEIEPSVPTTGGFTLQAELAGVEFKRAGQYRLEVRSGRKTLLHRILYVKQRPREQQKTKKKK